MVRCWNVVPKYEPLELSNFSSARPTASEMLEYFNGWLARLNPKAKSQVQDRSGVDGSRNEYSVSDIPGRQYHLSSTDIPIPVIDVVNNT